MYFLVIGPITPLADALKADTTGCLKNVGGVYIQGQAVVDEVDRTKIKPSDTAFNLREDIVSAEEVFDKVRQGDLL